MSVDALAEIYRRWSPYNYSMNNPVRYIDLDGMGVYDVIITGDKSKEVFNQLQQSISLKLKMDDIGKVTASGKAKTDADKTLLKATADSNVIVQVDATSSNFTELRHWYVGGAYVGSTVGDDGKTYTNQTLNPDMTAKIDGFYGSEKRTIGMHKGIASYIVGVDSPGVGAPTFDDSIPEFKAYKNAHDKANTIDPRHLSTSSLSQDPNTGHIYIYIYIYMNKPHPLLPQLNVELLINDLSKKK